MNLPSRQQCQDYFAQYKVPENIRKHCEKVQEVAVFLAQALQQQGILVNLELVWAASLLHDLFKMVGIAEIKPNKWHKRVFTEEELAMRDTLKKKYPGMFENEVAYEIFKEEFPELAQTLKSEGDPYLRQRSWEESIIHYADYRIFQEEIVSLQERFAYLKERYKAKPGFWDDYHAHCQEEERKIFQALPFSAAQLKEKMEIVRSGRK